MGPLSKGARKYVVWLPALKPYKTVNETCQAQYAVFNRLKDAVATKKCRSNRHAAMSL